METWTIFQTAELLIQGMAEKFEKPAADRMDVYMSQPEDLLTVAAGLCVKRLGYLAAITGLDPGAGLDQLEVLYHFCTNAATITLRFQLPKKSPAIASLSEIIPGAEPFERELREMFGITIIGLRNPDFLYLPDDWDENDFPLRKDFVPQDIPV
jgi:Ni,Fe-hydrogenase III component G